MLVTPCEILNWVPKLLSRSSWDRAFDFLLAAQSGFQGQPLKQIPLIDAGLIGSNFGDELRQMLRLGENLVFYNAKFPLQGRHIFLPGVWRCVLRCLASFRTFSQISVSSRKLEWMRVLEVGMESWVDLREIEE